MKLQLQKVKKSMTKDKQKRDKIGIEKKHEFLEKPVKDLVFLGIGSNLNSTFGDRFTNINLALEEIKKKKIEILKKSSFYETPSYPIKNNPKFINIVISILTDLSPVDLMIILLKIEEKIQRKRIKKNEPRTCDIDIIDYKKLVKTFLFKNFYLKIPHVELNNRNFVLYPLSEIEPNWIHPETGENVELLIKNLSIDDKKAVLKIDRH